MRQVLLATTALVAMGFVSAASADVTIGGVTISGGYELKYITWSDTTTESPATTNNSSLTDAISVYIDFVETLDNGMSMTMYIGQDETSTAAFDDFGASISGDFGTIGIGGESGVAFATATDVTDDSSNSISVTDAIDYDSSNDIVLPGDEQLPAATVSYLSPDISGFQFSVGMTDTLDYSDTTLMGAQYVMAAGAASVTLKYAASSTGKTTSLSTDNVDATSAGLVITAGAATLTIAQNTVSMGSVTDYTANSAGVTYKLSDTLTLQAYTGTTEDDKDTTYDLQDTGLGFTYTIAANLTVSVTHNQWDLKSDDIAEEDGDSTTLAFNLSF